MKQAIYRIYTEDKNYDEILNETDAMFQWFSVTRMSARWPGAVEAGLVIELMLDDSVENGHKVRALAHSIHLLNNQEDSLIAKLDSDITIVS